MASGGARSRSGPSPEPDALRRNRNDDKEWITLPAEGRAGPVPDWPLPGQSEREVELWSDLWGKPQAVVWEHLGLTYEVALLTRRMTEAELPGSSTGLSTLVKQLWEDLGLSVAGMRMNRWRIANGPETEDKPQPNNGPKLSARERLRVAK